MHIVVGQAEMMADLMDRHMADEIVEPHARLHPFGQDRLPIQMDAIGQRPDSIDDFSPIGRP